MPTTSPVPLPKEKSDRLPTSTAEQKILFARSGNLCAFPGCPRRLIEPETLADGAAVIGEIAHIVGASRQGPRGAESLTDQERASHQNLILMCPDHHSIVDAQPRTYSVPVLRQMKSDHEERMARLGDPTAEERAQQVVQERLYSSLLPITHLPSTIFSAASEYGDGQYEAAKKLVRYPRNPDVLTPFLLKDGRLHTFLDIRGRKHPFTALTKGAVAETSAQSWWSDPEGSRRYQTLLNRSMHKFAGRKAIRYDPVHHRYYFVPTTAGKAREVAYRLQTGSGSTRNVVWQPITRATGEPKSYWVHLAARLSFLQHAPKQWCLAIRPERHLTTDGEQVLAPKTIGRRVTRLKARMYNDKYLGELYLWLSVLSGDRPRFMFNLAGQSIVVESKLVTFNIEWPGVREDAPFKRVAPVGEDLFSIGELEKVTGMGSAQDDFDEEEEDSETGDDEDER